MIPGPWKINVIPPTAISTDVGPPLRLSPVCSKVIIPGGKVPSEHYRQTGLAIQDLVMAHSPITFLMVMAQNGTRNGSHW